MQPEIIPKMRSDNGHAVISDPREKKDTDVDRFCESPINTSFTKFNQRVQKLDLLKRRQSYSEFEELIEKKRELRERMLAKISLLREEHDVLLHEKKENDNSGKRILVRLEQMATDKEVDKYRQFLEEIEHITKLTVGLTIRLSRLTKKIENGRSQLSSEMLSQEKKKRKRLVEQTQEAEFLHRNTDRRSGQVRNVISRKEKEEEVG
jgi:protein Shroom